jgi:hypothetical protein
VERILIDIKISVEVKTEMRFRCPSLAGYHKTLRTTESLANEIHAAVVKIDNGATPPKKVLNIRVN